VSETNKVLVNNLCDALTKGVIDDVLACLSDQVFYHNLPYEPIVGRAGVKKFLGPFVESRNGGLDFIEYHRSVAEGDIVMNARSETWRYKDVVVVLPVAGVFKINNNLICEWWDYWDTATLQPILNAV
jgi:limonene-1,2-epoxide hydrolase